MKINEDRRYNFDLYISQTIYTLIVLYHNVNQLDIS